MSPVCRISGQRFNVSLYSPGLHVVDDAQVVLVAADAALHLMEEVAQLHEESPDWPWTARCSQTAGKRWRGRQRVKIGFYIAMSHRNDRLHCESIGMLFCWLLFLEIVQ